MRHESAWFSISLAVACPESSPPFVRGILHEDVECNLQHERLCEAGFAEGYSHNSHNRVPCHRYPETCRSLLEQSHKIDPYLGRALAILEATKIV